MPESPEVSPEAGLEEKDADLREDKQEEDVMSKRERLARTGLISLSFMLSLGWSDASRGPTLLDLQEIYGTNAESISFLLYFNALGLLVGSFLSGYLLDRFTDWHTSYLLLHSVVAGITIALLPHCANLAALFAIGAVNGIAEASISTGGNLMCLSIWRGSNSGPYMHFIHFTFGLGSFLAPLTVAPFLSKGDSDKTSNVSSTSVGSEMTIGTYYPLLGSASLVIALGYLCFSWQGRGAGSKEAPKAEPTEASPLSEDSSKLSANAAVVTWVMVPFFFTYVGTEVALSVFLPTFAVRSDLHLSKVEGAHLSALFWSAFALMRLLAVFAAIRLNPLVIMLLNLSVCLASTSVLALSAETSSLLVLRVCVGLLGFGMASVYATGLLWVERHFAVTAFMTSLFVVATSTGPQVYPVVIGQLIHSHPMFLMHVAFGSMVMCSVLFAIAYHFAKRAKQEVVKNSG